MGVYGHVMGALRMDLGKIKASAHARDIVQHTAGEVAPTAHFSRLYMRTVPTTMPATRKEGGGRLGNCKSCQRRQTVLPEVTAYAVAFSKGVLKHACNSPNREVITFSSARGEASVDSESPPRKH